MQPGQGEFGALFLDTVLTGHGVHAQPPLEHQPLANLHPVLELLGQIAPAHHLQLTRRIIGPQSLYLDRHLRHRSLIVLGVSHLGRFQHLNLEQTVIHSPATIGATHPDAPT
jgi:hypothetical protein